ncbi:MAG: ATP-dependent zinc metalloprotease FtsH [Bacteroidota bacterium]|nr:ATP-dependent zinc metalloprotease FtsH [Bacteroidota bacterium]MDW8224932.1 ATP-dependent zinc metalloprotease FtsH [Bacteroidota bacterium]
MQQPTRPPQSSPGGQPPAGRLFRAVMGWMLVLMGILVIYILVRGTDRPEWPITYTEYRQLLEEGKIASATIVKSRFNDYEFHGVLKEPITLIRDGRPRQVQYIVTRLGVLDAETERLWAEKGITWTYESGDNPWWDSLISILPWVALIAIYFLLLQRMQVGTTRNIFSFSKARVRINDPSQPRVTFSDVAGADEAKEELREVIEFLRNPERFRSLGAKVPKGVLLVGPPGTGKTLLARAVAGEAGVPFFSISGADFVEMFVGVGAARVRDLFEQAKRHAPCIVFIDELDAVGRQRGAGLGGGHDEREQTLNQLLVEMDGFEQNSGIVVLAATNRPDILDPALLRPGRFDRRIVVDLPDVRGREQILKVHTRHIPLAPDVELAKLAKSTPGFSGADLANLVNEAALLAARRNSRAVTMKDLEDAKDKILMGVERRSMVLSERERRVTAYHEAGHALVAKLLPTADPIHKVTIIPRGRALGVTAQLPEEDRYTLTKEYMEDRIVMILGGRAAERVVFHQITTGAANDLEQATRLARKMVCEWGMSEVLGPVALSNRHEEVFLGREIVQPREYSEETARLIDAEVRRIVTEAMEKAEHLLREHIDALHRIANALLEREVLAGEELDSLLHIKPSVAQSTNDLPHDEPPTDGQGHAIQKPSPLSKQLTSTELHQLADHLAQRLGFSNATEFVRNSPAIAPDLLTFCSLPTSSEELYKQLPNLAKALGYADLTDAAASLGVPFPDNSPSNTWKELWERMYEAMLCKFWNAVVEALKSEIAHQRSTMPLSEVQKAVQNLTYWLGYSSVRDAANRLGVNLDNSEAAWQELLLAMENQLRDRLARQHSCQRGEVPPESSS